MFKHYDILSKETFVSGQTLTQEEKEIVDKFKSLFIYIVDTIGIEETLEGFNMGIEPSEKGPVKIGSKIEWDDPNEGSFGSHLSGTVIQIYEDFMINGFYPIKVSQITDETDTSYDKEEILFIKGELVD